MYLLFKSDIVWKNRWRSWQKALFLSLFFLAFSQLNLSWKFELTTLPFSLSNVSSVLAFFAIIINSRGKRSLDLFFFQSARFERFNTAKNLVFSNSYFFFTLLLSFQSIFSPGYCSIAVFDCLHNGVKNIHVRKAWLWRVIGTENSKFNVSDMQRWFVKILVNSLRNLRKIHTV